MSDNELIAEFMGAEQVKNNLGEHWLFKNPPTFSAGLSWTYLCYHDSWDWLMPVVEKIANLYAESNHDRNWSKAVNDLRLPILSTTIGYVYKAVVEFIKWFNTQAK